ncbi:MAG TPA: PAC2 family protein [Thermoplasmata archaeon]|nr:PAC2 family protein [Thermoplasmata archaeon]
MADAFTWQDDGGAGPLPPHATVLVSFPSVGFAATVAAHFMIRALDLPQVGTVDSDAFPPLAVVQAGRVQPPIRVHAKDDFAVVVSEFPVPLEQARALAGAILAGAEARKASLVLSVEGVVPHPVGPEENVADESVWAVTAKPDAALQDRFAKAGARKLEDGVLGGVSGALLVEGLRRAIPTSTLLVSARTVEGYPDHRAGAVLIETLDRLLPHLKIDTKPLRSQAEMIEKALRAALKARSASDAPSEGPPKDLTIYQ